MSKKNRNLHFDRCYTPLHAQMTDIANRNTVRAHERSGWNNSYAHFVSRNVTLIADTNREVCGVTMTLSARSNEIFKKR